jgi:hypothetical protein
MNDNDNSLNWQGVETIPKVGRVLFKKGRSASYEAARRGDIPTVTVGGRQFVSMPALRRRLLEAGE